MAKAPNQSSVVGIIALNIQIQKTQRGHLIFLSKKKSVFAIVTWTRSRYSLRRTRASPSCRESWASIDGFCSDLKNSLVNRLTASDVEG